MAETAAKTSTCSKCGTEARENTQFCYNCGAQIAAPPVPEPVDVPVDDKPADIESGHDSETQAALDDLAEKLKADEPEKTEKLQKAADERRKARVEKRRPRTYRWEPAPQSSINYLILVAIVIGLFAGAVVAITVFVK